MHAEWHGLWIAERRFVAQLNGPVTIYPLGERWIAQVQGERVAAERTVADDGNIHWSFAVLNLGRFEGHQLDALSPINGHWIQPAGPVYYNRFATPVRLTRTAHGAFDGMLQPVEERYSLSIPMIATEVSGSTTRYRTFLRNPDRNTGIYFPIETASIVDDQIRFDNRAGETIGIGQIVLPGERFTLQHRGEVFDFRRGTRHTAPGFYPRRAPTLVTQLLQPVDTGDGWQTAALGDTGILPTPIINMLNKQAAFEPSSLREPYLHSLLVAHRGKLIVEEYFHGHHRDMPHDSRSAGKTIASALLGMAIHQGALPGLDMPVYPLFGGVSAFANPDPRKHRMTVRHLITMSSGLACDDDDPDSPGQEDRLQNQQEEPDYYAYTLALPQVADPGAVGAYCSAGINVVGGIIANATGVSLTRFFHESFAEPLHIEHYGMNLSPSDRAYLGGGLRLRPRDFLKLGQLYLNGGVWKGTRLVSEAWVAESFAAHTSLGDADNYGLAWWRYTYEYDGRKITTYSASGNGGQILLVAPELDLAIMMNAGNYSDGRSRNLLRAQTMWQAILPAVIDGER
ncbi:MAG: serine hydrolase [Pseudomonadota bacterium]